MTYIEPGWEVQHLLYYGLPLTTRENQLPWQCTLHFQTLWTRSVTKEGETGESHDSKQHAAHAGVWRSGERNLSTVAGLGGDYTSAERFQWNLIYAFLSLQKSGGSAQSEVRKSWRFRFWPFVTTHCDTTVSTFRGCFRRIGMSPRGWPARSWYRANHPQLSVCVFHWLRLPAFVFYGMSLYINQCTLRFRKESVNLLQINWNAVYDFWFFTSSWSRKAF